MGKNPRKNARIESAVKDIAALEKKYAKEIVYSAARRYNDRIYNRNKKGERCRKKRKSAK